MLVLSVCLKMVFYYYNNKINTFNLTIVQCSSGSYREIELFHNASVFGKKEDLYAVVFALGTMRVFYLKFWCCMGSAV